MVWVVQALEFLSRTTTNNPGEGCGEMLQSKSHIYITMEVSSKPLNGSLISNIDWKPY